MLWINCSMGTVSSGGVTGTTPVISIPGVRGSVLELDCINDPGKLRLGRAWPVGRGLTNSGVIKTINSVLSRLRDRDLKSLPRIGMSPSPGTFSTVSVSRGGGGNSRNGLPKMQRIRLQ